MAEFIVESIKHTHLQQTRSVAHIFRILLAHKFALSDPVATLAGFASPMMQAAEPKAQARRNGNHPGWCC